MVAQFEQGQTGDWRAETFDDIASSDYDLVNLNGRTALRGRCDDSASVFGIEREIDLDATPIMHWRWRVDVVYA